MENHNISAFNIPQEIRQEFSFDNSGVGYASQRGVARLAGVSQEAIRKLIKKLADNLDVSNNLQSYVGRDYSGQPIPDLLAAKIIEYYAFEAGRYCTEQAGLVYRAFAAIGIRVWTQQQLNFNPQPELIPIQEAIAIAEMVAGTLTMVSEPVRASLKLETLGDLRPDIKPTLQKSIKAIAATNPLPDATHTPTEIGAMVAKELGVEKVSAIAINKKLTQLGYQESITRINSKGKEVHHYYQPTNSGKEFGQIELAAFKAGEASTTKPNTRWFGAVVNVLVEKWETKIK